MYCDSITILKTLREHFKAKLLHKEVCDNDVFVSKANHNIEQRNRFILILYFLSTKKKGKHTLDLFKNWITESFRTLMNIRGRRQMMIEFRTE